MKGSNSSILGLTILKFLSLSKFLVFGVDSPLNRNFRKRAVSSIKILRNTIKETMSILVRCGLEGGNSSTVTLTP